MAIEHGKCAGQAVRPTAGIFGDVIAQLESSWGKPREDWDAGDWQRAALALNRALALAGELIEKQGNAIAHALQALVPTKPKGRGRPPSKPRPNPVGMARVKVKQLHSQRHLNFKQKKKYTPDDLFFLMVAVKALKIKMHEKKLTDSEALFHLFKSDSVRQGITRQMVKSRLAPLLSRGRSALKNAGVVELDEKVTIAAQGMLKGALK